MFMKKCKSLSLIIVYGPPGAGKTTLADSLHEELSYTAHIGVDHIKRFISEFRIIPSHQEVSKKVINAMTDEYLKNDISVIVEQGISRKEMEELKEIAIMHKAEFFVYRLEGTREVFDMRADERMIALGKPLIAREMLDALFKIYQENDYPSTRTFNSEIMSTQEIVDIIFRDIA